jgi:hypothetical protein
MMQQSNIRRRTPIRRTIEYNQVRRKKLSEFSAAAPSVFDSRVGGGARARANVVRGRGGGGARARAKLLLGGGARGKCQAHNGLQLSMETFGSPNSTNPVKSKQPSHISDNFMIKSDIEEEF